MFAFSLSDASSPLAMAEWIEIKGEYGNGLRALSPLARAEWIEMIRDLNNTVVYAVSASDGGVD